MRRVNFTGSTRVDKRNALTWATYLELAVLERGGKASLVVLDDTALDDAVNATASSAFANSSSA
jgi:acyl-CoA reductase-like NAD-dependent aldehyde dehydrogenase